MVLVSNIRDSSVLLGIHTSFVSFRQQCCLFIILLGGCRLYFIWYCLSFWFFASLSRPCSKAYWIFIRIFRNCWYLRPSSCFNLADEAHRSKKMYTSQNNLYSSIVFIVVLRSARLITNTHLDFFLNDRHPGF